MAFTRRIKAGVLGTFLLLSTLFTGCMGKNNIEEYMRPPRLTQEQTAIYRAMEEALGSKFILQYPVSGNYRSAFVIHNLDGDEEEEAIVFYKEALSSATMIGVLDQEDGEDWHLVYSVAGDDFEVESVSLSRMNAEAPVDILVQWRGQGGQSQILTVYSYESEERRLGHRFSHPCDRYVSLTAKGQDKDRLLIFTAQKKDSVAQAVLVQEEEGEIGIVDLILLPEQIISFQQLMTGSLDSGDAAVYLDVKLSDESYATQVICAGRDALWLLDTRNKPLLELTGRPKPICCQRDEEGVVRIPVLTAMPGYETRVPSEQEFSADMISLNSRGKVVSSRQCYISLYGQFIFRYPDVWKDKNITVVWDRALEECQFYEYSQGAIGSTPLLRIKMVARGEPLDRFELENYQSLAVRGQYEYYFYLPNPDQLNSRFNYEICREAFRLLW